MTDYTKNASFTAKTGTIIEGADFDAEFDEIQTAVASKEDKANKGAANGYCGLGSGGLVDPTDLPAATESAVGAVELATTAEVVTGTDTTRAVTAAGIEAWAAQNAGMVKDLSDLAAPVADRLLFWDFSAGAVVALEAGSGLSITGTTMTATGTPTTDAAALTTGVLADARVQQSNVTQHQAALTIAETQITDGSLLARVAANETISGTWTYSAIPIFSGQGAFPHFASATNSGGAITVSTADPSGTPAAGDIWLKYTA